MGPELDRKNQADAVISINISSTVLSKEGSSAIRKLFMSSLEQLPYIEGIGVTRSGVENSRLPSGLILRKDSITYEIFISEGEKDD